MVGANDLIPNTRRIEYRTGSVGELSVLAHFHQWTEEGVDLCVCEHAAVTIVARTPDLDGDGDVDLRDFAEFQWVFRGP